MTKREMLVQEVEGKISEFGGSYVISFEGCERFADKIKKLGYKVTERKVS